MKIGVELALLERAASDDWAYRDRPNVVLAERVTARLTASRGGSPHVVVPDGRAVPLIDMGGVAQADRAEGSTRVVAASGSAPHAATRAPGRRFESGPLPSPAPPLTVVVTLIEQVGERAFACDPEAAT